ncbi:MAG: PASTA domain-containing protein [Chloroflexi bacterium]|nr:PASTA domain-containing protein [Chloroflexota bacterium]
MVQASAGTVFGSRYRVERQIGATRHSALYAAIDELLNRPVVLKFLTDVSPEMMGRVLREARLLAEAVHPNVVTVYDVGTADGRPFLVLEHVAGQDLKALLGEQGPLLLSTFFRIAGDLAAAMDAVHRRGILHCDVKPQNIVVGADGRAKLIDFGIAQPIVSDEGTIEGTLAYLAPERLDGAPPGVASDVYAVGTVLYEALTGQLPYPDAPTVEEAREQRRRSPPPPGGRRAGIPAGLGDLVLGALAPEPADRPGSIALLAAELARCERRHTQETGIYQVSGVGHPGSPARAPDTQRPTLDTRRSPHPSRPTQAVAPRRAAFPTVFLLLALAGLLLVLVAGLAFWLRAELVRVPTVTGRPLGEAEMALRALELRPEVGRRVDAPGTVANVVVEQQPAGATRALRGDVVTLVVATGRVAAPNVVGKPLATASRDIERVGLKLGGVTEEETPAQAPGTVLRQEPPVDALLDPGMSIRLVVARALRVEVPPVVGLAEPEARDRAVGVGLDLKRVGEEETPASPAGTVLRQEPAPRTRVEPGTTIQVVVARVPTVAIPNVVGRPLDDARQQLEAAKLVAAVSPELTAAARPGTILRQSPEAGQRVPTGTKVDLVVATEPPAQVPNVVGRSFRDAERLIEQAGLRIGNVATRRVLSLAGDRVTAQQPPAGTSLKRGEPVDLTVEMGFLAEPPKGKDKRGRGDD